MPAPMAPELTSATLRPPAQALKLIGQRLQTRRIERAVFVGQYVGAYLDDHRMGQGDDFLANGVEHAWFPGQSRAATVRERGQSPLPYGRGSAQRIVGHACYNR